jgi:hypothetical protein
MLKKIIIFLFVFGFSTQAYSFDISDFAPKLKKPARTYSKKTTPSKFYYKYEPDAPYGKWHGKTESEYNIKNVMHYEKNKINIEINQQGDIFGFIEDSGCKLSGRASVAEKAKNIFDLKVYFSECENKILNNIYYGRISTSHTIKDRLGHDVYSKNVNNHYLKLKSNAIDNYGVNSFIINAQLYDEDDKSQLPRPEGRSLEGG